MHLNATGKASAAKWIVNWVNSVFIEKREKPVCYGKLNVMTISEVNGVKQDCFPLITSTSDDVNKNDFVNNLNNIMCGPVKLKPCFL